MYARHYRGRIGRAAEGRAYAEGQSDQPLHAGKHAVFNPGKDRSENRQRQISGNQNRHQRRDEQIDDLRHDFMQPLFQHAHEPYGDHHRDHMSLVSGEIDFIQTEPHLRRGNAVRRSHAPGVHQIRMDHDHADHSSQELVAAKYLRRADCHQNGQEGKRRVGKQMDDGIGSGLCHLGPDITQALQKAHQQAAGNDGRNNRNEHVSQRLDGPLPEAGFGAGGLFHFLFGCRLDARDPDEFFIDLIHRSRSENDLKLSRCEENTLYAVNVFHRLFVTFLIVRNHQPQSGGAVCGAHNV